MSTKINVKGKLVSRPGVYTDIKSGIKNPPVNFSYGNVLIIDTGIGATWGGGSAVTGQQKNGLDTLYVFDNMQQMRDFVRGGLLWLLAEPLFRPANDPNIPGVSKVLYIRAATTTKSSYTWTLVGAGGQGGTAVIDTVDEGLGSVGSLTNTVLTKGYGSKIIADPNDAAKFIFQFYVGTYRGNDGTDDYEGIPIGSTVPLLLCQSPSLSNIANLHTWMETDSVFMQYFKLRTKSVVGTGAITSADVAANPGFQLFIGGTETYAGTDIDTILLALTDIDFTFFLCDKYGTTDAYGTNNLKILASLPDYKYQKFMVVGGGKDKTEFIQNTTSSKKIASDFNTSSVIVVHGEPKKARRGFSSLKQYPVIFKAAQVLGRICGLEPQTPVTFKDINIDAEAHSLTPTELELGLNAGILMTYKDNEFNKFIVCQGVNALQSNDYLVNPDAQSHDVAVMRIIAQLNKEMAITCKLNFFAKNEGPNRNTITTQDLINFIDGFLSSKLARSNQDNLIIDYRDITVEVIGDTYKAQYSVVPNYPVNKIIITGVLLDK